MDSSLDWGQDLLGLKRYMERNKLPHLYLSYFGTDSPEAHGISYQPLPPMEPKQPKPFIPPKEAGKDFLAISATYLRGLYLREPSLYGWLADKKPVASIGGSIFIFDLNDDPTAHLSLGKLYAAYGLCLEAQKEIERLPGRSVKPEWEEFQNCSKAWERARRPKLAPDN